MYGKALALAASVAALVASGSAQAHTRSQHHYRHYAQRHHVVRASNFAQGLGAGLAHMLESANRRGLSSACSSAARQGGPCGCMSEEHFFGTSVHVLNGNNLWLAATWAQVFPHVSAAPGTAAVFRGGRRGYYHVAPVVAVDGSRITISDAYGTRSVSASNVTFVQPDGSGFSFASNDGGTTLRPRHYALRERRVHVATREPTLFDFFIRPDYH